MNLPILIIRQFQVYRNILRHDYSIICVPELLIGFIHPIERPCDRGASYIRCAARPSCYADERSCTRGTEGATSGTKYRP